MTDQPAPALAGADLARYVGTREDDENAASALDQAIALVDNYVGGVTVPVAVLHRAYLEVGSELFHRRTAPSGIKQFATPDGAGTIARVARDPMVAAYPLLTPFVGMGLA